MSKKRKTVPKIFDGSEEDYIKIAQIMDQFGGYSGRFLMKSFGRLVDKDGYNLLPRKEVDDRGQSTWKIDRFKDYRKVLTEEKLAFEEIPPEVENDIKRLYGEEEWKSFKKWVVDGDGKKTMMTRLMTLFSDEKYDKGHWKAIRAQFKGMDKDEPWNWAWLGRSPHVGLNLDPEVARLNRRRGNQADPSEQFLVNAGIPRNWMEAFIYYKDSQGLADRKEIGLSSRRLGEIGDQERRMLEGGDDAPQLPAGYDSPGELMEQQVNLNIINRDKGNNAINKTNSMALAMQGAQAILSGDYNEGAIKALQAITPVLPVGQGNITMLAELALQKGKEMGIEPFNEIPKHTTSDERRAHDVNMAQYREGMAESHAYLSEVLLKEDQQREIDYKKRVSALPEFGITERISHMTGGRGMTQKQVDEAESKSQPEPLEDLYGRINGVRDFLSQYVF